MSECIEGKHKWKTHRKAWAEANGPIPEEMCVCHRCNNPRCHNVDHLYLATHAQNIQDAYDDDLIPRRLGEDNPKTHLTPEHVLSIRSDSRSQSVIASEYGITQGSVSQIISRRTWRHV